MNHYQKIALVILRSVGLCLIVYSAALLFYAAAHFILLESKETGPIPLATNVLYFVMYFLTGALLYALSRPLAHLVAGRLKYD
jgi:surface polysaccharide O-acyltransferase-like enzyme